MGGVTRCAWTGQQRTPHQSLGQPVDHHSSSRISSSAQRGSRCTAPRYLPGLWPSSASRPDCRAWRPTSARGCRAQSWWWGSRTLPCQARDRCKAAVSNSGLEWPISLLSINLRLATLTKAGSHYDLAIVAAILAAQGIFRLSEKPTLAVLGAGFEFDGGADLQMPTHFVHVMDELEIVVLDTGSRREAIVLASRAQRPRKYLPAVSLSRRFAPHMPASSLALASRSRASISGAVVLGRSSNRQGYHESEQNRHR
jgi:hypothetical protein